MSQSNSWTPAQIEDQSGKTVVVTGTGGLGFDTAQVLAEKGARVIIAGRNPEKGSHAVNEILRRSPQASVSFSHLDLADLESVKVFSQKMSSDLKSLDILINNAGVMAPPDRQETKDGFELQMGTNFLGHFALTARLMPLLRKTESARVIHLASLAHRNGKINFNDPQWSKGYKAWPAYSQSKLAMLMFSLELHRRSERNQWGVLSVAVHPGFSNTDLFTNGPGQDGNIFVKYLTPLIMNIAGQSSEKGSWPTLFAATSDKVESGQYYGPDGLLETKGSPARAKMSSYSQQEDKSRELWQLAEKLTGLDVRSEASPS